MDIKVLRYFLALAQEESITAAAESLHLTQPTLSRQLIELEEDLGVKLFVRGSRKITLTDEGIRLRKRAQEILELVQKTAAEFQISTDVIRGDIYIGGGETYAMGLIAEIVKDLQDDYPQIHVHLFSGDADEVLTLQLIHVFFKRHILDFHSQNMTSPFQDCAVTFS